MPNFNIQETAKHKIITVGHRGVFGGNIPCNTLTSYEIALHQGADMIEIDVDKTADGQLVIFHPGMEWPHLRYQGSIRDLTYAEIKEKIRYVNIDDVPTEYTLCTLDEVFETFKDRCYINVDKFWDNPELISDAIRRHNMTEQIIVKTKPTPEMLNIIETYASDIQYMPVIKEDTVHEELLGRNIRYVGAEVLFDSEDSGFCSDAYIEKMHSAGKLIWVNSIVYDYKTVLTAHHSDDAAMRGNPELGWGWLADRGYDIIQTDWPLELTNFLRNTGRLER